MKLYPDQTRYLAAVDCIVFGYDGQHLKILLVKRSIEPEKDKWSLMGGFVQPDESSDAAAIRILKKLTGLEGIYLEQLATYTDPHRDPIERTISIVYFSLIDLSQYQQQLSDLYHAEWFHLNESPTLIFDHNEMLKKAKEHLRYKAAIHPILFELLPAKFTLPMVQSMYEDVYGTAFDKGNFSRKIISTGLLLKQKDKDKAGSKKGAFYYRLNKKQYSKHSHQLWRLVSYSPANG